MNNQEKQAALMKLAQVRLAINHILRARAMQKQAIQQNFINRNSKIN